MAVSPRRAVVTADRILSTVIYPGVYGGDDVGMGELLAAGAPILITHRY